MSRLLLTIEDRSGGEPQDHRAETREQDHLHTLNSAPEGCFRAASGRSWPVASVAEDKKGDAAMVSA
jgi:hypothetical protein